MSKIALYAVRKRACMTEFCILEKKHFSLERVISKTKSILISLKSNKFPSLSFTEGVKLFADLLWEIYRFFLFLFALYVLLSYGLPLTWWLTRTSDCLPFQKRKLLSVNYNTADKYVFEYFNSFTFKQEIKIHTQKNLANQRLQWVCPWNALLIWIHCPKTSACCC